MLIPAISCARFDWASALTPSVACANARGEVVEVGAHVDEAEAGHLALGWALLLLACERHVHRTPRLVAARGGTEPGHPSRVGHRLPHPDLHVVRAVAVPEHERLSLWAQLLGGSRETGGHGLVHEAAGIGGYRGTPTKFFAVA